jgi:hypothetical protein
MEEDIMQMKCTALLLCVSTMTVCLAGPSLITNGDFEGGNTQFSSDYIYFDPGFMALDGSSRYGVGKTPRDYGNAVWPSYGDHTSGTGNMLIANGATDGRVVWRQSVPVDPATTYAFTYFLSSWGDDGTGLAYVPSVIEYRVNGQVIGSDLAPGIVGLWEPVGHWWYSGASTTANIELRDLETAYVGNDFAIDDMAGNVIPAPGAAILGGIGVSLVTWLRRRKTL